MSFPPVHSLMSEKLMRKKRLAGQLSEGVPLVIVTSFELMN